MTVHTLTPAQQQVARRMSESELTDKVVSLAQTLGYLVHFERPARTKDGWRTPIAGKPGFPDLVLVDIGRVLFVELKAERGRWTHDQVEWRDALEGFGARVRYYTFLPSDWLSGAIEAVLRGEE